MRSYPDGKSEGMTSESIGRGQKVMRAYPQDNQTNVNCSDDSCRLGSELRGGLSNIGHTLKGAVGVGGEDLGTAGDVKHVFLTPGH